MNQSPVESKASYEACLILKWVANYSCFGHHSGGLRCRIFEKLPIPSSSRKNSSTDGWVCHEDIHVVIVIRDNNCITGSVRSVIVSSTYSAPWGSSTNGESCQPTPLHET